MNTEENIIYKIAELKSLNPVKRDVMQDEYQMSIRFYKLQKAVLYSTRFRIKSIITLQTKKGEKKIKSHVLKLEGRNIILKGKIGVPIKSIKDVKYEL